MPRLPGTLCTFSSYDWILSFRRRMGLKIDYCGPRDLLTLRSNRFCSHISRSLFFLVLSEQLVQICHQQTRPWHKPGLPLMWICQKKNCISLLQRHSWCLFIHALWSLRGLKQVLLAMHAPSSHGTIVISSVQHVELQLRWKMEATRESVSNKIAEARQVLTVLYVFTIRQLQSILFYL